MLRYCEERGKESVFMLPKSKAHIEPFVGFKNTNFVSKRNL
jgi:hypothetical protein